MRIGSKNLNDGCYIIAELSANHNGSIETAIQTIRAAKEVGADAIKLQTYTADTMTLNCKKDDFQIKGTIWDGANLYELYKQAYTPWEWHAELFQVARDEGLDCFSTPFDFSSVDFLEKLNPLVYKIASFEITDIPLIRYVAQKGKPIIISTGIATKEDIDLALDTIRSEGVEDIVLLKCTSSYPAPLEEANLSMIRRFEKDYNVVAGLSDHTLGIIAPVVAVTLGAKVIEKHFILDRSVGGPDSSFSLDKKEFADMVQAVRNAEKAVGKETYELTEKSKAGRDYSRSLYFSKDLAEGQIVTEGAVKSVRPGFGLHPKYIDDVMGKKVKRSVKMGDRVSLELLESV
jgi:pseudaminic acid synthase